MATKDMLKEIDQEIARLQHIRMLLMEDGGSEIRPKGKPGPKKKVGRPAKATQAPALTKTGRRPLSPEARERIAAAQRKRWAASKKAAKKAAR